MHEVGTLDSAPPSAVIAFAAAILSAARPPGPSSHGAGARRGAPSLPPDDFFARPFGFRRPSVSWDEDVREGNDRDESRESAALQRLGFEVTTELDADRVELTAALRRFTRKGGE